MRRTPWGLRRLSAWITSSDILDELDRLRAVVAEQSEELERLGMGFYRDELERLRRLEAATIAYDAEYRSGSHVTRATNDRYVMALIESRDARRAAPR